MYRVYQKLYNPSKQQVALYQLNLDVKWQLKDDQFGVKKSVHLGFGFQLWHGAALNT